MEDITIVNGAYQPTFNWGATLYGKSPCFKGKSSINGNLTAFDGNIMGYITYLGVQASKKKTLGT